MKLTCSRRAALQGLATTALVSACGRRIDDRAYRVSGRILGADWRRGHQVLSAQTSAAAAEIVKARTVIVGGGAAGLAAAYTLDKAGHSDYVLCEMADDTGGNAIGGGNSVSRYPWGAHYVPILDPEDGPLVVLFDELGIIKGRADDGSPVYEEDYLCADPDERLWILGQWQQGFVPSYGISARDRSEIVRFDKLIDAWRKRVGADGRRAFALPLAASSEDPELQALDVFPFSRYLSDQGFRSEPLLWYLDYCCRDDFGAPTSVVSTWAGLHYFCARRGRAANATHGDVLTWPQGNAFLTEGMTARLRGSVRTKLLVTAVQTTGATVQVDAIDVGRRTGVRIHADAAIVALPVHVLKHVLPEHAERADQSTHYPWVVANITVRARPGGAGAPLAWDNVRFGSKLLGYVVADHQQLGLPGPATVLTYYWPLSHLAPDDGRRFALSQSHEAWCRTFLDELYFLHPDLIGQVENADIWVWGHGMSCPVPGYCGTGARDARRRAAPPLFFAHTDLSGISVFEEAFWQGRVAAADRLAWSKG